MSHRPPAIQLPLRGALLHSNHAPSSATPAQPSSGTPLSSSHAQLLQQQSFQGSATPSPRVSSARARGRFRGAVSSVVALNSASRALTTPSPRPGEVEMGRMFSFDMSQPLDGDDDDAGDRRGPGSAGSPAGAAPGGKDGQGGGASVLDAEFERRRAADLERYRKLGAAASQSFLTSMSERIKNGVFGVLYIMAKDTDSSVFWTVVFFLIDFLQLAAFPFSEDADFPWNDRYLSWFGSFITVFDFERYLALGGVFEAFIYVFAFVVVMGVLAIASFTAYTVSASRNKFQAPWLLRTLRTAAPLFVTSLFIPLLKVFVKVMTCPFHDSCTSGVGLMLTSVTVLISVFFVSFSLLVAATFYNPDPHARDLKARPHSRLDLVYVMFRAALVTIFGLFGAGSKFHWVLIAYSLIGGLMCSVAFTLYVPSYSFAYSSLRAAALWFFTWESFCLLVTKLYDDPGDGAPVLVFYGGLPFIVFGAAALLKWRRQVIIYRPVSQMSNAYEVEMKARFYMAVPTRAQRTLGNSAEVRARDEDYAEKLEQAMGWFREAANMHSLHDSSILRLLAFNYATEEEEKDELLAAAEARHPQLDELFIIYRSRKSAEASRMVQASSDTSAKAKRESADVVLQMTVTRHKREAMYYIERSLRAEQFFWKELLRPRPDLNLLHEYGMDFNQSLATAEENLKSLMGISSSAQDPRVLRLYGVFLCDSSIDMAKGIKMLKSADALEYKRRKAKQEAARRKRRERQRKALKAQRARMLRHQIGTDSPSSSHGSLSGMLSPNHPAHRRVRSVPNSPESPPWTSPRQHGRRPSHDRRPSITSMGRRPSHDRRPSVTSMGRRPSITSPGRRPSLGGGTLPGLDRPHSARPASPSSRARHLHLGSPPSPRAGALSSPPSPRAGALSSPPSPRADHSDIEVSPRAHSRRPSYSEYTGSMLAHSLGSVTPQPSPGNSPMPSPPQSPRLAATSPPLRSAMSRRRHSPAPLDEASGEAAGAPRSLRRASVDYDTTKFMTDGEEVDLEDLLGYNPNAPLHRSVRYFRLGLLLTLFAWVGLALSSFFISVDRVGAYESTIDALVDSSRRHLVATSIVERHRTLELMSSGVTSRFASRELSEREAIRELAYEMESLNTDLYDARGDLVAEHVELYTDTSAVQVEELTVGDDLDLERTWNLAQASKHFVSKSLLNSYLPLASAEGAAAEAEATTTGVGIGRLEASSRDTVYAAVRNGFYSLDDALNKSSILYQQQADDIVEDEANITLLLLMTSLLIVLASFFGMALPIVFWIVGLTDGVLAIFRKLPRRILRRFQRRCEVRLKNIALLGAQEQPTDPKLWAVDSDSDEDDEGGREQSASMLAGMVSGSQKKKRAAEQKSTHSRNVIIAKVSVMFVVALVYYLLYYYFVALVSSASMTATSAPKFSSPTLTNEVMITGKVAVLVRRSLLALREWLVTAAVAKASNQTVAAGAADTHAALAAFGGVLAVSNSSVVGLLDVLAFYQRGLLVGVGALQMDGVLGRYSDVDALASNLCSVSDNPDCDDIDDGVLVSGLGATLRSFVQSAQGRVELGVESGTAGDAASHLNATLQAEDYVILQQLDDEYLYESLQRLLSLLRDQIKAGTAALIEGRSALLIAFLLFLFLAYQVFYARLLHQLDDNIKRTIAMLLVIPTSVLLRNSSTRHFIVDQAQKAKKESLKT